MVLRGLRGALNCAEILTGNVIFCRLVLASGVSGNLLKNSFIEMQDFVSLGNFFGIALNRTPNLDCNYSFPVDF